MNDNTRVFNQDCLEAMKSYPTKYFDLAIVDPPYGIGESGNTNKSRSVLAKSKNYGNKKWDEQGPDAEYFEELFRVSKSQIIWGANHFGNLPPAPCWIVWDKVNGENDFADCELAWTSFDTAVRQFTFRWHGMLQGNMKDKEERIHPTQKPVALYKWLLKNYAKEGDKILDTHGGSMSSVIACLDMGYSITCYELDSDYYAAGKKRIEQYLAQQKIFDTHREVEFIT